MRSSRTASTTAALEAGSGIEPLDAGQHCIAEPAAPVIDAMTTIDSDSMMIWSMPAMVVGSAFGTRTFSPLSRTLLAAPACDV